MAIEEKLKMYREKKNFIWHIANLFIKNPTGHTVLDITYEVVHKEMNGNHYFNEWIIVHFKGGATSPCIASGNSNVANFRAIAKLIEGGHYEEKQWYEKQFELGFKKVDLTKLYLTEE